MITYTLSPLDLCNWVFGMVQRGPCGLVQGAPQIRSLEIYFLYRSVRSGSDQHVTCVRVRWSSGGRKKKTLHSQFYLLFLLIYPKQQQKNGSVDYYRWQ